VNAWLMILALFQAQTLRTCRIGLGIWHLFVIFRSPPSPWPRDVGYRLCQTSKGLL
jgi:hypothetical protein